MDQQLREQVCRLIAGIVVSDDDLDAAEDAFLERIMAKFDIAERSTIFPIVDRSEAAATMRHLPAGVQQMAMTLLIEAATADGKVVPEERTYLEAVADELSVSRNELEKRIQAELSARSAT